MSARKVVHTRKIALIAEYGFTPNEVAESGFTSEFFTVRADKPRVDTKALKCVVLHRFETPTLIRYYWRDEDVKRAEDAIEGDYRETFGEAAEDAR